MPASSTSRNSRRSIFSSRCSGVDLQRPIACRSAFLDSYFASLTAPGIIPNDSAATDSLLDLFVVEKALYELRYEINHRPDWVAIPLAGLNELFPVRT